MKKRKQNRICADGLHTGCSRCQVYMNGGATWINTEEKSAENVADEIFRMIEKSRLQKYT